MIKFDKNTILLATAVLAIAITGVLIFANLSSNSFLSLIKFNFGMSKEAVAKKSVDYLNSNILQAGQTATLESVSEESGVIKIKIKIGSNSYDSYVTKDGKILFPEGIALKPKGSNAQATGPTKQTCDSLAKVEKPLLEAYVVSNCPYGLQMQRAMDNAIANIPSLAQYVKVRYIGEIVNGTITAMHGDAEAKENLKQICLREEQNSKYWPYVSCYMRNGDGKSCETSENVDVAKLNGCVSDENRGLAYAKEDFDLNKKYNITGSPTLLLNGQKVSEFDFGGRSSEAIKQMISCSSSTNPSFSSTALNTEQAAIAFSVTYAGTGSSANNAANCAPAQ